MRLAILIMLLASATRAQELLPINLDLELPARVSALEGFWGSQGIKWTPPTTTDKVLLAASALTVAADIWLTVKSCNNPTYVYCESGPMILFTGMHPSTEEIIGFGASAFVINAVLWYVLPDTLRKALSIGVVGVESYMVGNNLYYLNR
jgi:hypothetical protein